MIKLHTTKFIKYSPTEHLKLRTAIDSFIIAYDQAVDRNTELLEALEEVRGIVFYKKGPTMDLVLKIDSLIKRAKE